MPDPLSLLLRAARTDAGLTQLELSSRLGCSRSLIAQWETGRSRPTLSQVEPLAEALGLSIDQRMQILRLAAPASTEAA